MRGRSAGVAGGALLVLTGLVLPPARASSDALYETTVTSGRDVVETVGTTRRLDDEAIEQESARTLDEALVRVPGLVVRTGGDGVPRIDMRGLRSRHVLLLVDGIPFTSTEDGQFDPSLIPVEMIESIDLSYSNNSVLYGDGPIGGVIQIRTRSGEQGVQGALVGDVRESDQYEGRVRVSGGTSDVDVFVSGSGYSSHAYRLPDSFHGGGTENGGLRDNSRHERQNAFTKLGWRPTENAGMGLLLEYRHAQFGVPPVAADASDPFAQRPRFERVENLEGFSSQLSGYWAPVEALELRSWGYVNRQTEDRRRYDDDHYDSMLARDAYRLKGTSLVSGGSLHARYAPGDLGALRAAFNGRFERFDSRGRIRDVPLGGGSFAFRSVDEDNHLAVYSLGLEYDLRPTARTGVVLGFGESWFDPEEGGSQSEPTFLVGGYVDVGDATRVRGSVARKIRFPSLRQLYDVDGGNPELNPERSYSFELGVEHTLPWGVRLGLTGFQIELRDFIERLSGSPFENRERLRMRGIEVTAAGYVRSDLYLRTGYTLLDARDRASDSPFDELQSRPRHKLDAEVRYTLPSATIARAAVSYVADTFVYSRTNPPQQGRLGNFTLLDLRLTQPLLEGRLRLYFGVDNVLDEQWSINYGFPLAGRTYYGGVELRR